MGNTVWILDESTDEDSWDHSVILANEKSLDKLAKELGVKTLSQLFDFSILEEELGGNAEPNYFSPDVIEATLAAFVGAIRSGYEINLSDKNELLEELDDCISKVLSAKESDLKVRMAVVP